MRLSLIATFVCLLIGESRAQETEYQAIDHVPAQSLVEAKSGTLAAGGDLDNPREINSLSLALIKHFEGWVPNAYNDPSGYCTIGYGHLIALDRCENIALGPFEDNMLTEQEGEDLLIQDTVYARRAVDSLTTKPLADFQFGALSAFVFNVGTRSFYKSTMLKYINAGDYSGAGNEFKKWVKSKKRVLPGLLVRRSCEKMLYVGDLSFGATGLFERSTCENYAAAPSDEGEMIDLDVGEN
jgi:lysozyme